MASVVLHPNPQQFPIGTTVKVFELPANAPASYLPSGAAASEPVVEAGSGGGQSTLTVAGVTVGKRYVAEATIEGVRRALSFSGGESEAGGGGVSSVNGKTGAVELKAADVEAVGTESPALTGNPTVPTQAAKNSSTRVASTAFVQGAKGEAETGAEAASATAAEAAYRAKATGIPLNTRETWGSAAPEVSTLDGRPVVVPAAGETAKAVRVDYEILEGTSATFKLQKNGVDMTGFTGLKAEKSAQHAAPTAVALAEGDIITCVVTAVAGSPKHLSVTLHTSHTV